MFRRIKAKSMLISSETISAYESNIFIFIYLLYKGLYKSL